MDLFSQGETVQDEPHIEQQPEPEAIGITTRQSTTVTYSPEDNKIRLYVGRVPRAEYERLRAAGYVSTPKQDCDFVATWTPRREDIASEYLEDGEEIGDEDYSPLERAADRAERFGGYLDKRRAEAVGSADTFEAGPAAFGHQSHARAERQARRHDRSRTYAVSQWSKASYWEWRTAGVISNALYKADARVRRGRILTLEAEQRKQEKVNVEYAERYYAWEKVIDAEGADQAQPEGCDNPTPAYRKAFNLANYGCWGKYTHPRTGQDGSIYSHLTDAKDPITPREAATLWLENAIDPTDESSSSKRWQRHYELRLNYERAMLANEGGTAAAVEMVPGGWIKGLRTRRVLVDASEDWVQILSVTKSPKTGRIVSVKVMGTTSGYTKESDYKTYATVPAIVTCNVERLGEDCYRAPTPEELETFQQQQKKQKAEAKAKKPVAPPTINPTDEDAARLQALWNDVAADVYAKAKKEHRVYGTYTPTEVCRMTQEQYSARSKGAYASFEIVNVLENGKRPKRSYGYEEKNGAAVAFKVRKAHGPGGFSHQAERVIVITDKPQKPIPLDWEKIEAEQPNVEGVKA